MDPDNSLLSIETTFCRLKTILYEQQEQLTWNEKLKRFPQGYQNQPIGSESFGGTWTSSTPTTSTQSFDNDAAQRKDQEEDLQYSQVPEYTKCGRERRLQVNYEPESMPSKSPGNSRLRRQHRRTKSKSSQREVPESPDTHTPSRPTAKKIVDPDSDNDAEDESDSLHQSTGKVLPSIETTNTPPHREPNPTIEGISIPAEEKTSWDDEEGVVTGIWSAKNESRKTRREIRERKAEVIDLEARNSPPKTPPPKLHKGKSVGVVKGGEVDDNTKEHNKRTKPTSIPWPAGREQLARILGKVHPQFPLVPESPNSASASSPLGGVVLESAHSMSVLPPRRSALKGGVIPTNRLGQKRPVVEISQRKASEKVFKLTGPKSTNILAQPQHPNKRQRTNGQASDSTTSNEPIDLDSTPPQHRSSARRSVLSQNKQIRGKNGSVSSSDEFSRVERQINPSSNSKATRSPYFPPLAHKEPSNSYEDDTDPIMDVDMSTNRPNGKETRNSYLPDPSYSGTASRDESRPTTPLWRTSSEISKSRVLPSHPDDLVKKPPSNPAKRKHESAGSMDELAIGHGNMKRTAKKENPEKIHAEKLVKAALDGIKGGQDFVELDDTDDETAAKEADIAPAPLKKPKKPTKNDDEHIFPLIDAFSTLGLMKPASYQWRFVLKKDEKIFRIIDNDEQAQYEIPTRSLQRFEWSEYSAKVILYRLPDGYFKGQSKAFLELKSIDDSAELRELLLKLEPTLTLKYKKDAEFLDKVFLRDKVKKVLPKPARQKTPEDVQLIGKNAEMRQAQKRAEEQDLKQKGRARVTNPTQQTSQFIEPRRAEGLARRMVNADTIAPNKFYDKSSNRGTEHSSAAPATRFSTRNLPKREPVYQERTRSPTPPPVAKWTRDNPGWEEHWLDTVVYPPGPGHKRTATVDRGDIERLDEEEFLNDSLVNFYLRYLEYDLEKNRPDVAKRIYFQNSFFYERLTKPPAGGKKGIDYAAVQRWTKGVDLFSKDYIIVPVCENIHWYVAIICNAPKLLKPDVVEDAVEIKTPTKINADLKEDAPASHSSPVNPDNGDLMEMESLQASLKECIEHEKLAVATPESRRDVQESNDQHETNPSDSHPIANIVSDLEPNTAGNPASAKPTRKPPTDRGFKPLNPNAPRIMILDSLGGGHPVTSKNLRDYLIAEMKDKHGKEINPPGNRQMHFAAKNLEGQKNYSDCGLFLLSYVQKFLENPESFISGILGKEVESYRIQPKKMREDIRNHLFELQTQSSKKRKRPSKPSDVSRAVLPKLASRDATHTGIATQAEILPAPPNRTAEKNISPNDVALAPTSVSATTTHHPRNDLRPMKPAASVETSAKMTKSTVTRSHKGTNGSTAKGVVDLANGIDSERTSADKPLLSKASKSTWGTSSNPDVIDEDISSTLQELAGSSHVLTPRRSEPGSRLATFLDPVKNYVNGLMGCDKAEGGKQDAKDLGNSASSPVQIDDSPAKPGRKREKNHQKRRSRSSSVEEFTPSKRQRSSPKPSRDSPAKYERGNVDSDQVLEPPSPALRSPDFGDFGQKASGPSSAITAQKNGNKSPDGQKGDDYEMLLLATEACKPKISSQKSSSPTTENSQRQGSFAPLQEFEFDEMREDEEEAPAIIPGPEAGSNRPRSQKSSATHIYFDSD